MRTLACHLGGCTPSNNFSLNISLLLLDIALQLRNLRKHLKSHLDCFSTFSFSLALGFCLKQISFVDCNFGHYVNNNRESKMSDSEVESNSLFKCDVCLNDYGPLRQQKFLPCLHSFCQSCLTEIHQADGAIKCPICRELHVDSRNVSSLPSNYFEALKKMESGKNETISFYAEKDEINLAHIRQLEHFVAQLFENIKNFMEKMGQLEEDRKKTLKEQNEDKNKQLTLLKELHDQKSDIIVQLMRLNSKKEKEIHQLKEQVAILKNEQN